jgi:two-component system, LytTR family, sensor kinase
MLFLVIIRYGLFLTYYSFSSNIFPTTPTLKFQISGAIIITNRFLFIAVPFYLFKKHISDLKEQAMIDRKQNSLKKSMLSSELLGLKNQINPHFLYNILNFLYAHSIPLSYKLSKSILILSEIMRYAIRENEDEHKVPFEKEVIYLKNYIELENLQRDEYSNIKLEINGNLKYRRIPPLTFQPILDKIFTHGKDITIKVNVEEDMISFSSEFKRLEKIDFATFPSIFENFNKDFFLKNNVYHSFNYNSDNQFYNLCLQIHS